MRILALSIALVFVLFQKPWAQCSIINTLQVVHAPGQVFSADMECTDAAGWTHYYNSVSNLLLLSIKKNGQDIGSLGNGLVVEAGTLSGYGSGGFNLSGADYIDNDVWMVANRYWQVKGANPDLAPVGIRFYFQQEDVSDIAASVDDFGFFVDGPEDLLMFTLSNGGDLFPLSTITQPTNAIFTLYDMVPGPAPDWVNGTLNGNPYSEYTVNTLDNGGGAGFLIFQQDPPVSVSGHINRANGAPVKDVKVEAATSSVGFTDANGVYICPTLITGAGYTILPTKNTNPAEGISVIDLIYISRHLMGLELFSSPYTFIAANADNNNALTTNDLNQVRDVLLGNLPAFPNNQSWRFVPTAYPFQNPGNPFAETFPESIQVPFLTDTLLGQDFVGIKTGDVADGFNGSPPMLDPRFLLSNLTTCNPGDTVVFELKVQEFTGIRGFQFTLQWDAAVMEFLAPQNFSLGGFTGQSIGANAAGGGKLAFAWFNPGNGGSTLPDGTSICQLKFLVTGNDSDETPLSFTDATIPALIVFQNLSHDVPSFTNGHLLVENNSQLTATGTVVPAGCSGQAVGSIDLAVAGGVPPLAFHWSNGAVTEDLANLPGGIYRVTVSDASGNCPNVFEFAVAPTGPIALGGSVSDMSCPTNVDGAIDLQVADGAPPFTFLWSNGKTSEDIAGLFVGAYTVTVTDAVGCTASSTFEVQNPNKITPSVSIVNASNANASNGAVIINSIAGSIPPFAFSWSNGATTQSVQNVPPGDYIVTISDGAGCTHVFGYLVNDLMVAVSPGSSATTGVQFSPNPVKAGGIGYLTIESDTAERIGLTVFTSKGEQWGKAGLAVNAGENLLPIEVPAVPGVYFIRINRPDKLAAWVSFAVY
ncbi:MAG: hypothetical protein H6577_05090 [Lewinellaceae bacterium]|nr:hypothetical protein [Saprospiraceae bacterium]MCB9337480.1 hypothetical protein [Lewinellaceae bacterium]